MSRAGWAAMLASPAWRVVLFFALVSGVARASEVQPLVSTVCAACHGVDGNSVVPTFPKLAGLQPEYLSKQLKDYLSGKRKNEVMAPALESVKDNDVPALATFFSQQIPVPGKVEDAALVAAGKKLYDDGNVETGVPACGGCHQPKGEGNARFPRVAGQHQAYTLQQMSDFKSGARANDKGKVMRTVAERMTEQEMKAVSEYLAGL